MQSPKRLLLLEDNDYDADMIRRKVRAEWPDYDLIHVATEAGFSSALDEGGFELILSDYVVPGFEGRRALALARARRPEIPFLFISGAIGDEIAVESLKAGP